MKLVINDAIDIKINKFNPYGNNNDEVIISGPNEAIIILSYDEALAISRILGIIKI